MKTRPYATKPHIHGQRFEHDTGRIVTVDIRNKNLIDQSDDHEQHFTDEDDLRQHLDWNQYKALHDNA